MILKSKGKDNGYRLRGNCFFVYLKVSIADLIKLLSSSVQNSEGSGHRDGGDSCADPCQEFKQGFLVFQWSPPCLIIF